MNLVKHLETLKKKICDNKCYDCIFAKDEPYDWSCTIETIVENLKTFKERNNKKEWNK